MPKAKSKWDSVDLMFQALYGIDGFAMGKCIPNFGSQVQFQLAISGMPDPKDISTDQKGRIVVKRKDKTSLRRPTLRNLAIHFGYTKWVSDATDAILQETGGRVHLGAFNPRLINSGFRDSVGVFEDKVVEKHRKALQLCEWPMFLYCVPAEGFQTELKTGKITVQVTDRVLALLPNSPEVGVHYGLTEEDLRSLAPQVVWLITSFCSHRIIYTPEHLFVHAERWVRYLQEDTVRSFIEQVGRINPQLVPERYTRRLLPSS